MNPVAQPETNELLDEVLGYIKEGQIVNEFCKHRLIKAVKNQPTLERKHALLSLIYTSVGDKQKARENAYQALKYIEQPATITNALMSFQLNGLNLDIINVIHDKVNLLDDLNFAKVFIPFLISFPNISCIERIESMLVKTNKLSNYSDNWDELMMFMKNADIADKKYGIDKNVIGEISRQVAGITQNFNDVILNYSNLSLSPSKEWFSLIYYVELEDEVLTDLNWELADKMIEMGLDELPLVARFEIVPSNEKSLREQYVC
ncbi:hypothetical protein ACR30L_12035 [Psychromonas sp. PT13]|uniref:hypothetical protein n=1 Tax=Psychromonas sp. PT13 TaxID=3439547 RepID=UPI003EBF17A5